MKRTTISKNLIKTITTRNTIIIITLLIRKQSFRNKYIAKKNMQSNKKKKKRKLKLMKLMNKWLVNRNLLELEFNNWRKLKRNYN